MFKKVIIAAFLATAAFTEAMGGYHTVTAKELLNLENDEIFVHALKTAKQGFQSQVNGVQLGRLVGVQEQVVAGMNYKMTFNTSEGQYEVTVFCQPWTNTYEVTSIKPVSALQ